MKPSLPRFIEFKLDHGGLYIMSTDYPFSVSQIWKFADAKRFDEKRNEFLGKVIIRTIPDYHILLADCGNLSDLNSFAPHETLTEMSSFFLSRINERAMGWRRYLIEKD